MFRRDLFCTVPNISPHSTDTTRLALIVHDVLSVEGFRVDAEASSNCVKTVGLHAYILTLA